MAADWSVNKQLIVVSRVLFDILYKKEQQDRQDGSVGEEGEFCRVFSRSASREKKRPRSNDIPKDTTDRQLEPCRKDDTGDL